MAERDQSEVRVVVADDHALARRQLIRALAGHPRLRVVGEAEDGAAVLVLVAELAPDVVVVDVRMPVLDGFEVCRRLGARGGPPAVLVSAFESPRYREAAAAAGAASLVGKAADERELVAAVLAAAGTPDHDEHGEHDEHETVEDAARAGDEARSRPGAEGLPRGLP